MAKDIVQLVTVTEKLLAEQRRTRMDAEMAVKRRIAVLQKQIEIYL